MVLDTRSLRRTLSIKCDLLENDPKPTDNTRQKILYFVSAKMRSGAVLCFHMKVACFSNVRVKSEKNYCKQALKIVPVCVFMLLLVRILRFPFFSVLLPLIQPESCYAIGCFQAQLFFVTLYSLLAYYSQPVA